MIKSGPTGPLFFIGRDPPEADGTVRAMSELTHEPKTAPDQEPRLVVESGVALRVAAIIEPAIVDLGYRLVRVRISAQNGCTLQIMAERPDGTMNVEGCEEGSQAVSPALGGHAKIDTSEPVAGRKRFRGILRGVAGQDALLTRDDAKSEEERDVAIPMRAIAEARLVLTDALVTESLRRGKSGLPPEMPSAEEIASPRKGRGKSLGPRPTKAGKTPQDNNEEE